MIIYWYLKNTHAIFYISFIELVLEPQHQYEMIHKTTWVLSHDQVPSFLLLHENFHKSSMQICQLCTLRNVHYEIVKQWERELKYGYTGVQMTQKKNKFWCHKFRNSCSKIRQVPLNFLREKNISRGSVCMLYNTYDQHGLPVNFLSWWQANRHMECVQDTLDLWT